LLRSARNDKEKGRAGFTLVEVIVVLVILAILAAIAIPALTGYIDKADEKKWIAQARNAAVAVKTLLTEDYAAGKFASGSAHYYFTESMFGEDVTRSLGFSIVSLSRTIYKEDASDGFWYFRNAADLMGEEYSGWDNGNDTDPWWNLKFVGKPGSTALTADGFVYIFYPDGYDGSPEGQEAIIVTYKIKESSLFDIWDYEDGIMYDANAGYVAGRITLK
jgi:prepilin-type N-terminal cleavage/methylation domain-containing protein